MIQIGLIKTYTFFTNDQGFVLQRQRSSMFLPQSYSFKSADRILSIYKIILVTIQLILVTFEMVIHVKLLIRKTRSLFKHRVNEFQLRDFTSILQTACFVTLFIYGGILFIDQIKDKNMFSLPIRTEKDFQYWVEWSQMFNRFRIVMGIIAILQCLNFLLVASNYVPSLGILFETLSRAKRDIFSFTMCVIIFFFCGSVACTLLYGDRMEVFKTLSSSLITNFQMFFGEVPYEEMYKVNSVASAVHFVSFVFVFFFFVMNIYTAIIVQTYQQLRRKKFLLSAAMWRIIQNDIKTRVVNWFNLLTLRPSRTADSDQNNDPEQFDNQSRMQILRNNWAIINRKKITTKEQFVQRLSKTANEMRNEQLSSIKDQQERLQGLKKDSQKARSSAKILKRNFVFIIYLGISWVFFTATTNNELKQLEVKPIVQFLNDPSLSAINKRTRFLRLAEVQTYDDIINYTEKVTEHFHLQRGFGFSKPAGKTFCRLNYHFYKNLINSNLNTASIFPITQYNDKDSAFIQRTYDERINHQMQSMLILADKKNFQKRLIPLIINFNGKLQEPKSTKDYRGSCMGNGGYVFEFGTNWLEKTYNQSVKIIMKNFIEQNSFHKLDILNIELFVYSPANNFFTYIIIEFDFKQSGQIIPQIFTYVDNIGKRLKWYQLLLYSLFSIFTLYFVANIFFKVKKQWTEMSESEEKPNQVQRTKMGACLIWIGIDTEELRDYNIVQIIFVSIFLIIKNFFKTIYKLFKALLRECGTVIFNYVEISILVLNLMIIANHGKLIYVAQRQPDPKQLQSASEMASTYQGYAFWCGISIVMMFFKSLEIFQFSMVANLTISTIVNGMLALVNYIIIFVVLLFGEATAAYIVFGSEVQQFSSVQVSIFTLLKMLNGAFQYREMNAVNPFFATPFFVYVLVLHWLLLLNILIGLIKGQFFETYENLLSGERQKILKENWTDGFYLTIWRILSEDWIQNYMTKTQEAIQAREKNMLLDENNQKQPLKMRKSFKMEQIQRQKMIETVENQLNLEPIEPQITWGNNWPVPAFIVMILNWWLDPYEKRLQIEQKVVKSAVDDYRQESSRELTEQENHKTEQESGGDEVGEELLTPFKLDQDYKVDKGINPYLRYFDEIFQAAAKVEGISDNNKAEKDHALKRLTQPQTQSIMKLREQWQQSGLLNNSSADSNFWLFHLDENLLNTNKRQTQSLHEMRSLDTFFSSKLVIRSQTQTDFQKYVQRIVLETQSKDYQVLLQKMQCTPDKFLIADFLNGISNNFQARFGTKNQKAKVLDKRINTSERVLSVAINYKYAAWVTIDRIKRQQDCDRLLNRKIKETESDGTLALKIISTLEKLNASKSEEADKVLASQIIAKELSFDTLIGSAWRNRHLNMICNDLRKVWRSLSLEEKFELWYNRFDVWERVRLWNGLVFSIEWFNMVVTNSQIKVKKLGPSRTDVAKVIDAIRKKQECCAEEHAKKEGLHSLSVKEKDELKYLAYGATQLKKLWETLTKDFKKQEKVRNSKPKKVAKFSQDPRQLFEGGSDDDHESQNDNDDSKQGSSTGVGSGRQKDDAQSEENVEVKVEDAKADQSSRYYAQIQFFFRNMVNHINDQLKEIRSEQEKGAIKTELTDEQKPKFTRTFAQFEKVVQRLQHRDEDGEIIQPGEPKPLEEERLQLWALLTKHEKFDMMFHQVVLHEAQIMSFLLEAEHGELGTDTSIIQINEFDNDMEVAINQQIYRKYIAYTRLQAIRKSKTYFENRQKAAHEHDQKVIRYASFLKERFAKNEQEISQEQAKYDEKQDELKRLKNKIQKIAIGQKNDANHTEEEIINAKLFYNLWKNNVKN